MKKFGLRRCITFYSFTSFVVLFAFFCGRVICSLLALDLVLHENHQSVLLTLQGGDGDLLAVRGGLDLGLELLDLLQLVLKLLVLVLVAQPLRSSSVDVLHRGVELADTAELELVDVLDGLLGRCRRRLSALGTGVAHFEDALRSLVTVRSGNRVCNVFSSCK